MLKEEWTEEEILSFSFESDNYERKVGEDLRSENFDRLLAKALSAFANTNGGHIVLGLDDGGAVVGVSPNVSRTPTEQWINQKTADLLVPDLRSFRVHPVPLVANPSSSPDKILIVIDVEPSDLAPHQSLKDFHYYYRVGSESKPAPHRYIESLFSRQKFPGPNVANALIQTVINPMLWALGAERTQLEGETQSFDRHSRERLGRIAPLLNAANPVNWQQFFRNNPEAHTQLASHDQSASALIDAAFLCHESIVSSALAAALYEDLTSIDNLSRLKDDSLCPQFLTF